MRDIFLTNSLSRKKEKFEPINRPNVGMYSCGPTVYDASHIGHMRRYVGDDILKRVLKFNRYKVKHVMNVTDVGHLTSDADTGEDKVEKAAKEEGKSAWDIAKFFEEQFFASTDALNIKRPDIVSRATEHIREQIDLIKKLEGKGFTYKTADGVYFNTSKFPEYGNLAGGKEGIKPGARVDVAGKKNPTDFALWKFSPKNENRQMEWESPWGIGFPGWHIECSAMSMKYLGETFDIHTGGVDHIQIHHTNEIAQSEAVTGKPFVKYWIHHEFLMVDGQKMAKSLGNTYTVDDVVKKGFNPLALRYLYLTAHYRDPLNFTWDSLASAQNALENLKTQMSNFKSEKGRTTLSVEKDQRIGGYRADFLAAVNDDLNTPRAMAILWEMLKSNIPDYDNYDLITSFDEVLGLKLGEVQPVTLNPISLPSGATVYTPISHLSAATISKIDSREIARNVGDFGTADEIRKELEREGFKLGDTEGGTVIYKGEKK